MTLANALENVCRQFEKKGSKLKRNNKSKLLGKRTQLTTTHQAIEGHRRGADRGRSNSMDIVTPPWCIDRVGADRHRRDSNRCADRRRASGTDDEALRAHPQAKRRPYHPEREVLPRLHHNCERGEHNISGAGKDIAPPPPSPAPTHTPSPASEP